MAGAPSVGKSRQAANRVFDVIDEKSLCDVRDKRGVKKIENGEITLEQADFKYPSRK